MIEATVAAIDHEGFHFWEEDITYNNRVSTTTSIKSPPDMNKQSNFKAMIGNRNQSRL